jgi:hypothetical protein
VLKTLLIPTAALTFGAATLPAQNMTCGEAGDKNPKTARTIGIIPGAGHIYTCEFLRGLGLYVVTTSTIAVGTVLADFDCVSTSCKSYDPLVIAAGLGLWGWSIYDAGRAAERTNAKRRRGRLSPILTPVRLSRTGDRSRRGLRIGVSVKAR